MPLKRPPILLAALALAAALALGGCGGGDEGDGGEATSQGRGATSAQQGAAGPRGGSGPGGGGGGEGEGLRGPGPARAPADPASLPEPTEGSKRAAPGVPTSKGGDNSIQTWGLEASAAEREEVTATLQAFYDARARAEWARACTHLAARQKAELAGFIRGRSGNAACAEAMGALAEGIPPEAFAREARIDYVLSARAGRRDTAFLIYTRTGEDKVYANAFAEEDGAWKVVSIGPTTLY